jgi:DNA-binding NtrC family response regulator
MSEKTMKPVWIVDDDRSIRWVLEKTLSREQILFKSFASASEALSQLDAGAEPPQVLVSDIRMPGQSGLDLLQQFKERFPSLPVIIMTAYSDLESAVAAFQGGAFEYLPKPFDVDQALELAPNWCARGRRADAGNSRSGACHAGGFSRHRPAQPVARDRHDYRRVGSRQGACGARRASAQPARRQAVHRD